ncbi:hypothetical protein AYO37_00295 [Opitutia bacterium SCGC AG-212-L18]|nr:hypothetical protein AYO37_00295 [Opitutae bacterium SCGC AG-212-L18]
MALSSPKLKWIVVRLGQDMNWWVEETSDPINWDTVDGLSLLDPRQIAYVIDAADQLIEYGFQLNLIDQAFYKFRVVKDVGKGQIKLERVKDSLFDATEPLFALPNIIDEEKGPYADLINQLIYARIKMLNDLIDFEQHLTIDELEEEIREHQAADYMEGKAIHVFSELIAILEYVPEGYELDVGEEEVPEKSQGESSSLDEEFPDLEEEDLEQDETMRWGDEDEEDLDEDDDNEKEEEDAPVRRTKKKNS